MVNAMNRETLVVSCEFAQGRFAFDAEKTLGRERERNTNDRGAEVGFSDGHSRLPGAAQVPHNFVLPTCFEYIVQSQSALN
jgi:hypothetical protein